MVVDEASEFPCELVSHLVFETRTLNIQSDLKIFVHSSEAFTYWREMRDALEKLGFRVSHAEKAS